MKKNGNIRKGKSVFFEKLAFVFVFILDAALLFVLISSLGNFVIGAVGGNATVSTYLTVGAVTPQILNVTINAGASTLDLAANSTVEVVVQVLARDYDGEDNMSVSSIFFDSANSAYGDPDDNNEHYTNGTCLIDTSYGSVYEINATCRFNVWYYAFNSSWNATVNVTDNTTRTATGSDDIIINPLLALGVPESIDYGIVNESDVSLEKMANVTNFGNVMLNLSLEGYARTEGDNLSMNCTLGNSQNISVEHQKYNLTASNGGSLTFTQFGGLYLNLSSTRTVKTFNLDYRRNDTGAYFDDTNATFWRIYVPVGVAGSCRGNLIFGANIGPGTP